MKDPSNATLFSLGLIHYILFVFLALSIFVLFLSGLLKTPLIYKYKIYSLEINLSNFIFQWWFPLLVSAILSLSITSIKKDWSELFALIFFISVLIFMFGIYFVTGRNKIILKQLFIKFNRKLMFYSMIFLMPYWILMSLLFSDVKITTDKNIYTNDQTVHFTVDRNGYMFHPQIKTILFNFYDTLYNSNKSINTNLELPLYKLKESDLINPYISVVYQPQIFGMIKRKDLLLKIVTLTHNQQINRMP